MKERRAKKKVKDKGVKKSLNGSDLLKNTKNKRKSQLQK
jgi:hypothetical protein